MPMTDLNALIERLERSVVGSRELDALIECEVRRWQAYAVGLNDEQRSHWKPIGTKGEVIDHQGFTRYHPPTYSFSIDAAMTLVPQGWSFSVGQKARHKYWHALVQRVADDGEIESFAETSCSGPIALCLAISKAQRRFKGG